MNTILYGRAYDLAAVIDTGETRAFLLEERGGDCFGDEEHVDLGRRRILSVGANTWLVLVKGEELTFEKLLFPEREESSEDVKAKPAVHLADILRNKGISCRTVTKYRTTGSWSGYPAWWHALKRRAAVFSEAGYALQYRGWLDYTFYQFELHLLKKGWLTIGGHDIESVFFWNVMEDILGRGRTLIERALEEPRRITEEVLTEQLKASGLWEEREWLRMVEREQPHRKRNNHQSSRS